MQTFLIGVDEVGRGALAGQVCAAAVVLRDKNIAHVPIHFLNELIDSKKLSEKKRLSIYQSSIEHKLIFGLGFATVQEIDQFNILNATMMAMARAVNQCVLTTKLCALRASIDEKVVYDIAVDGIFSPKNFGCMPSSKLLFRTIKSGDSLIPEISCASIIAKVTRDGQMRAIHNKFSIYDFKNNKGYGTRKHMLALEEHGASKIHRLSFRPVREVKNWD